MLNTLANLIDAMRQSFNTTRTKVTQLYGLIRDHVLDINNPHRTDKFDVGLGKVANHPPATREQAIAGKNNNSVMSPKRVEDYMAVKIYTPLTQLFEDAIDQLDE